jgi:hypothetical protein
MKVFRASALWVVAMLGVACGGGISSNGNGGDGGDGADAGHDAGGPGDAGDTGDGGLTVHCSGASPGFSSQVHPILEGCGGEMCHGGLIQGGSVWAYDTLVNVHATRDTCNSGLVLVTPGSLDQSYLINKLTGVGMCATTSSMPIGNPLPQNEIQLVADWICSGAPNN